MHGEACLFSSPEAPEAPLRDKAISTLQGGSGCRLSIGRSVQKFQSFHFFVLPSDTPYHARGGRRRPFKEELLSPAAAAAASRSLFCPKAIRIHKSEMRQW